MGNKKTQKQRRAPGTDKKTRSKGIGYQNPKYLLNSDWSMMKKSSMGVLGYFKAPNRVFEYSEHDDCVENCHF